MKNPPAIQSKDFVVKPGAKLDLHQQATICEPFYQNKDDYRKQLNEKIESLQKRQELLYADNHYSLLIIFQAMDAAGKDGAIRHVMSGVNPQGCQVHSFKHPSATELDHDFLWRTQCALPERGCIGIFNRSYYEEVLIVKVQPHLLAAQNLPGKDIGSKNFWRDRYRSIVESEAHLVRNGTSVIKFFLHMSKEEQARRFLDRINDPEKQWKFSVSDIEQRKYWDEYMAAYAECLSKTSSKLAPWYLVPADDKKNARLIISTVIQDTLSKLKLAYPAVSAEKKMDIQDIAKQLADGSL
jgi:PPK2 family polyphosphate:nucleotide phosphotransferase